ncbi:MAG: class I SAM-dependent methyltransferase [Terriglobales bacterium]
MTPATLAESTHQLLSECISHSQSRFDFWINFIRSAGIDKMVEVGVYQGDFAAAVLAGCERVSTYYMLDPWRHLDDWNKPANQDNSVFESFFQAAKAKTEFAAARRTILRGKTTEVIDQIADGELDFAYIDGDHTLKGITIDLVRVYPKVKVGGFIGGDDFSKTIWMHKTSFEPTLVFPYAVYFAEAVGATIYALPNIQFCLQKMETPQFRFVDLTHQYGELGLRDQLVPEKLIKMSLRERYPRAARVVTETKRMLSR